jgi:hypothetical protein
MAELFGTILAAIGFMLLSEGLYLSGFILGVFSCIFLIPVFIKNGLFPLLGLQLFFFAVNINGIVNNI